MFKVGERVRLKNSSIFSKNARGKEGKITATPAREPQFYEVKLDDGQIQVGNEKHFEMISNLKFWMVYGEGRDAPTVKHDTYQSALEEAKRLSRKHHGTVFYVLEMKSKAVVEQPEPTVTEH